MNNQLTVEKSAEIVENFIDPQIKKNVKISAQDRIKILADKNSFQSIDDGVTNRCNEFNLPKPKGDGVITGVCQIFGQNCAVFLQDFSVLGGSLGEMHAKKICKIMDIAGEAKMPLIAINDSGGARIQEGVHSLSGYGEIFQRNVNMSGYIPQVSLIMGPCAGGAVYSPALTDFIFMTANSSFMFVTGPNVVKTVLHEDVTKEELGGAKVHDYKSGVVDLTASNDLELLEITRQFMHMIPKNNDHKMESTYIKNHHIKNNLLLNKIIPAEANKGYDMLDIINNVVDIDSFFEIKANFATNIIIGLATLNGRKIGIVANQPNSFAGCLDIHSAIKAARFVRFCDAFNIPLVTFVDTPGFLPGTEQEHNGVIKHGAKLLYAFAEATVPKITIITRKAYGGAYITMCSKHLGADFNFSWPEAEIAVMGVAGASQILFKKYLNDPEKLKELTDYYSNNIAKPYIAASMGYIDDIILPEQTRSKIDYALNVLINKNKKLPFLKKHDNLPL